jgi:hypothetical protein
MLFAILVLLDRCVELGLIVQSRTDGLFFTGTFFLSPDPRVSWGGPKSWPAHAREPSSQARETTHRFASTCARLIGCGEVLAVRAERPLSGDSGGGLSMHPAQGRATCSHNRAARRPACASLLECAGSGAPRPCFRAGRPRFPGRRAAGTSGWLGGARAALRAGTLRRPITGTLFPLRAFPPRSCPPPPTAGGRLELEGRLVYASLRRSADLAGDGRRFRVDSGLVHLVKAPSGCLSVFFPPAKWCQV